ncbi:MAG: hypothetical protein KAS97_00805, partial [Candidatus Aminicenantes bacterium]|nr:hypothetical protein [Candidatus Aminicenantes bacterium]
PVGYADDDLYEKIENIPISFPVRRKHAIKGGRKTSSYSSRKSKPAMKREPAGSSDKSKKEKYKKHDYKGKKPFTPSTESPKKKYHEVKKSKRPMNEEERLEYYKKKYGDNFKINDGFPAKKKKRSFVKRVLSVLKK